MENFLSVLSETTVEKAVRHGDEYGWRYEDVVEMVLDANRNNLVVIRMMPVLKLPDRYLEFFWLSFSLEPQRQFETNEEYLKRNMTDTIAEFSLVVQNTDFKQEALNNMKELKKILSSGEIDLARYIIFIPQFDIVKQ